MKGGLWVTIIVVLFLLAVILHQGILALFALILALATGTSALWARFCLSNVSYQRHLAHHQIAFGEETSLVLEFTNAKPLPLAWLLVRDRYPREVKLLTGEVRNITTVQQSATLVNLLALSWYQRVTRTYRLHGAQRGMFEFGPAEMSSGDMFGARQRHQVQEGVDRLVVFPKVVPVEALGLPANRPMGEWRARRRVIEDPLRFSMVRPYAPGDNPRYIHWKATARTGRLQTKVFEPSDTLSLTIAANVATIHHGFGYVPDYLEYALSAAASLAVHALNERYMVGLCANSLGRTGSSWVRLRPSRHPAQATALLTALASLGPFRVIEFEQMLYDLRPFLPFGATVAAITAIANESIYEALLDLEQNGYPTLLLTIGDSEPQVPEGLTAFHLGGSDAWQGLDALELA
jgi:uncharacterized protein (DUF58 family)